MKKRTHEEFIQQVYNIVKNEYTFLEKYIDARTKIEVVHNICNYKYKVTPDGFLNKGTRCPKCAIKNNTLKQTKTHNAFIKEVFDLVGDEYKFIDNYINTETKIKVKHNKCGCIYEVKPANFLSGYRCPICCHNPQKIIKGINSMWDTNPELAKLLLNPEDGYKYTYGSSKRVNWKCPNCDTIINNKIISTVYKNGLSCLKCSDGKSYAEKFMNSLLGQLNIEFEIQKTFEWSKNVKHINPKLSGNKVYDFFLPKYNTIIETHGIQHYEDSFIRISKRARNSSEEQENDVVKQELAKNNNITNYISVNCRESNMKFIKNNILNCQLNNLFDLSQIDWEKCAKDACNSLVIKAYELWNSGIQSTNKIGEILKIDRHTALRYLKQSGIYEFNTNKK